MRSWCPVQYLLDLRRYNITHYKLLKFIIIQQQQMNDFLKQINSEIETGGRQNLYNSLNKLNQIQQQQFINPLTDAVNVRKLFSTISQNIDKNKFQLGQSLALQTAFNQWISKLPPRVIQQHASQISHINRTFRRYQAENVQIQKQQIQNMQQVKKKFADNLAQADIFKLENPNPKVVQVSTNNSPIQQSLVKYSALLQMKMPSEVVVQNAPQSVQFLARYAQTLGYTGIGTVSGSTGRCFIGTKNYIQGDGSVTLQFPQNQIQYPNVPDLPVKIQYYANKTINSWNKFVSNQAKMINFLNKISGSPDNRVKYIQQSLKYLNLQQFAAQALATLTYYYFYLPLLRFSRFVNVYGSTQAAFYKNYEPADKVSQNPLLLPTQKCIIIAKMLTGYDSNGKKKNAFDLSTVVYKNISDVIKDDSNQINKKAFQKLSLYQSKRNAEAQTYFKTSGIPPQRYQKILSNKKFSVKERKFIFNDQFTNNQLVQIIDRVTTNQKIQLQTQDLWNQTWGSKSLYSFDYIFRDN